MTRSLPLHNLHLRQRETSSRYTNKTSNKASTTESLGAHSKYHGHKEGDIWKDLMDEKEPAMWVFGQKNQHVQRPWSETELEESKHRKEASVSTAREGGEGTWDRAGGGRDQWYTALGCHHEEWDLFYMQRKILKQGNDIIWSVFPRSGWLRGRLLEGQGKQGWVRKRRQFSRGDTMVAQTRMVAAESEKWLDCLGSRKDRTYLPTNWMLKREKRRNKDDG